MSDLIKRKRRKFYAKKPKTARKGGFFFAESIVRLMM